MNSFGNVIKIIRKERRLTQKMLSQDICSQSVLSRIENDEELPNVVVMDQLCQRLGVTIDQVLHFSSGELNELTMVFERMAFYFRQKNYFRLESALQQQGLAERLYLDTDLQQYYYYLGSCEFFLHKKYEQAIIYLKRGLSYTFRLDKQNVSDIEIQIISCLGKVYNDLGKIEEARYFLEKSIRLFHLLPNERMNVELTKIFFNYSSFLYECDDYQEALRQLDFGIEWARQKNSYYYLEELFILKAKNLTQLGQLEDAATYNKLAQEVIEIAGSE